MNPERLVEMANDIAAYFQAEPDRAAAIDSMATHLQRFWEPRMRRQIVQHLRSGGSGLQPLARDAVARMARQLDAASAAPWPQDGGSAA
jgi:formate dehydrogenase subunit delta